MNFGLNNSKDSMQNFVCDDSPSDSDSHSWDENDPEVNVDHFYTALKYIIIYTDCSKTHNTIYSFIMNIFKQ